MTDLAFHQFQSHGISVLSDDFPNRYFDSYIHICNPELSHPYMQERLEILRDQISSEYYEKIIVFGATITLMKEYHYDFIVAMMHDAKFCDWIMELYKWFEPLKKEIEQLTSFIFK